MSSGVFLAGFPTIIPARVLGQDAPSKTIQVGQIGFGRIASHMDVPGILRCRGTRVVALCDVDARRLEIGREFVDQRHAESGARVDVRLYRDYHEMLARPDIDAVAISTPDHWHSQPAIEAVFAGKDVYLQKPAALTISEGRLLSNAVQQTGRVFLLGSQQRSMKHFHRACELVRNGRLGKITRIEVGLPGDADGGDGREMPVPASLDYDTWLGATPEVFYAEDRVHPQDDPKLDARPGWLRCGQFGSGMITGWGSHHMDIVHWAMGWERTGPVRAVGRAKFLTGGLWDVHGAFEVTLTYADGTPVHVASPFPNGIRFLGENGWIFVSRESVKLPATEPLAAGRRGGVLKPLDASDPGLLAGEIPSGGVTLRKNTEKHHQHWIHCIRSREETIVPAEVAHSSCSACLVAHAAMKLGRELAWDPAGETFANDAEANAMLSRAERAPHGARRAYERLSKGAVQK